MVREQIENQMRFILAEINRCEIEIRMVEETRRKLEDLRRELERLAESYAKMPGIEDAERKLFKIGWEPVGHQAERCE